MNKKNLLAMSMVAAAMTSTTAFAAAAAPAASSGFDSFIDGLDKSFAVTTNYVFRGISQGEGLPAAQGGVTYNHASGLSVDFWMSSSAGTGPYSDEYDVTVSYSGKASNMSYEVGVASYSYPQFGSAASAHEIFGGVSFNMINAYLYINPKDSSGNNTYIELSTDLTSRFNIALGLNSNDAVALDYNQITANINLNKNLDYSISQTDVDGAKAEMALTYSMSF